MCDYTCSNVMCMLNCLPIKPKKIWVFYMFLKVILYFCAFSFCSKCIFVLFFKKKPLQRHFCEKLTTKSFSRKEFKGNLKISFSYKKYHDCLMTILWPSTPREMIFKQKLENTSYMQRLSRLSRNCFVTKSFLWNLLCFSGVFHN